jgi:hypothetical protein
MSNSGAKRLKWIMTHSATSFSFFRLTQQIICFLYSNVATHFGRKTTINLLPIQHFKVEIKAKYFASIFTLWDIISSQELLQYK